MSWRNPRMTLPWPYCWGWVKPGIALTPAIPGVLWARLLLFSWPTWGSLLIARRKTTSYWLCLMRPESGIYSWLNLREAVIACQSAWKTERLRCFCSFMHYGYSTTTCTALVFQSSIDDLLLLYVFPCFKDVCTQFTAVPRLTRVENKFAKPRRCWVSASQKSRSACANFAAQCAQFRKSWM